MGIEKTKWVQDSKYKFGCFSIALVLCVLAIISLACALPSWSTSTPQEPTPTLDVVTSEPVASPVIPTPTPPPLPPTLIESNPPPGTEISTQGPITLYFNQAMDRGSVESAIIAQDGLLGEFQWEDSATVTFIPDEPFSPGTSLDINLSKNIQAANGLFLHEPQSLTFEVMGYLRLTKNMPAADAVNVDPASPIAAIFNRPVMSLEDSDEHIPAFWLEPTIEGRGEWVNVSTYIFYPEPSLAGGADYTVYLDPDLISFYGSPLQEAVSWSFSTRSLQMVSIMPTPGARSVRLDSRVRLVFNQPMDVDSVEANLVLLDPDSQPVPGEFSWNEELTEVTYNPRYFLKRDLNYSVLLSEQALSRGGTGLGSQVEAIWKTSPSLEVIGSQPSQNGIIDVQDHLAVYFTAPTQARNVLQFVSLIPRVDGLKASLVDEGRTLHLYGDFNPESFYSLIISPNLPDAWSGRLGEDFVLNFQTQPRTPELILARETDSLFLTPQDSSLTLEATNLTQVSYSIGSIPLDVFTQTLIPDGLDHLQSYVPHDQRNYQYGLELPPNERQQIELPLSSNDNTLVPGLYLLDFNTPFVENPDGPFLLLSSNVNLTLKIGAMDAMVWAVDLRTKEPISEAAVSIYAEDGELLGNGLTDTDGVFKISLDSLEEISSSYYALLDQPGDDTFGLALSIWNQGLQGWNHNLPTDYRPPRLKAYLYSDRSVYQPGQTVFFRGLVRQIHNGRYNLPSPENFPDGLLTLNLYNEDDEQVTFFNLPLSPFGTVQGSYNLPQGVTAGNYSLVVQEASEGSLNFQVVVPRASEIELDVAFSVERALAGEPLQALIRARYFYDAPAAAVPFHWDLYKVPVTFDLPDYQVGSMDMSWLDPKSVSQDYSFENAVLVGEGVTDREGVLQLDFLPSVGEGPFSYVLEVFTDEDFSSMARAKAEVLINQKPYFIGVRPDSAIGQAGTSLGFDVKVVDWDQNPYGELGMRAEFLKVAWERENLGATSEGKTLPNYVPRFTLVGSTDFVTADDGVARLSFTPPDPGIYQLSVSELSPESSIPSTQVLVWVGGLGEADWPELPNQRLHMIAAQNSYLPGETAQVFLPNPFESGALALVTVERGVVLRHRVLELEGAGTNLYLPLAGEDAPNVIVSVTLLGTSPEGRPDYRYGYLNLSVEPHAYFLNVELSNVPEMVYPGEDLMFEILATDSEGNPVEAEFSISVVEQSELALAENSGEDISKIFYWNQPLGVRTGMSMSASTHQPLYLSEAENAGSQVPSVLPPLASSQSLVSTAFWDANIVTNDQGEAQVSVPLPAEMKSWDVLVRGLTSDTKVGQTKTRVIVSKELLVRPITPRFLVMGDHTRLAADLVNMTQQELSVEVNLGTIGFELDSASSSQQSVRIPAGEQTRVFWWGKPQEVEAIDLVFSARAELTSGGEVQIFEDVARPSTGTIPVIRYISSASFSSTGYLQGSDQHKDFASLPRSFQARGGELRIELSTSLIASMMTTLGSLENSPSDLTEQIVSKFLPNLQVFLTLRELDLPSSNLQANLERSLQDAIPELLSRQNSDGGWGWWKGEESDHYISAYVVFGLSRARAAGATVDGRALQDAVTYLQSNLQSIETITETWQFDRLAITHYVLSQVGSGIPNGVADLYDVSEQLNPGAQALLALTLEYFTPGDLRAQSLFTNLTSAAISSSHGVYWEDHEPSWRNLNSTLQTSAVVLLALAQSGSDTSLIEEAVRFQMAHRNAAGFWQSSYDTAWIMMAQAETMKHVAQTGAEFQFTATLNGAPLASGAAGDQVQFTPVIATQNLRDLYHQSPNSLVIERDSGVGDLYFSAQLLVDRPVESISPLYNGFSLSRQYYPANCIDPESGRPADCTPIKNAVVGDLVEVRLTLTVAETSHFVIVKDHFPAGVEVLGAYIGGLDSEDIGDDGDGSPFRDSRGMRFFSEPQIHADHITWAAQTLSPGTYELTYKVLISYPGEYGVLPPQVWQYYSSQIKSNGAGELFMFEVGE